MRGIRERSLLLKRERGETIPFLPTYLPTVVIIYLSIHPSIRPSVLEATQRGTSFCLEAFVVAFVFSTPPPPPPLGRSIDERALSPLTTRHHRRLLLLHLRTSYNLMQYETPR